MDWRISVMFSQPFFSVSPSTCCWQTCWKLWTARNPFWSKTNKSEDFRRGPFLRASNASKSPSHPSDLRVKPNFLGSKFILSLPNIYHKRTISTTTTVQWHKHSPPSPLLKFWLFWHPQVCQTSHRCLPSSGSRRLDKITRTTIIKMRRGWEKTGKKKRQHLLSVPLLCERRRPKNGRRRFFIYTFFGDSSLVFLHENRRQKCLFWDFQSRFRLLGWWVSKRDITWSDSSVTRKLRSLTTWNMSITCDQVNSVSMFGALRWCVSCVRKFWSSFCGLS